MGIFSKISKDGKENDVINATERILRENLLLRSEYKDLYSRFLYLKEHPEYRVIDSFELYASAVNIMITSSPIRSDKYVETMAYGEKVYDAMFPYEERTPDYENLTTIFLEMFDKDGVIARRLFIDRIYDIFSDKFNYMKWVNNVKINDIEVINAFVIPYAVEARSYFLDEECYLANLIDVTWKIQSSADKKTTVDEELEKIRRMAGIYEVNEAVLLDSVRKIEMAQVLHKKVVELTKVVEERVKIIDATSRNSVKDVKTLCEDEVKKAQYELSIIDEKLKQAYDDCVAEQKKVVLYEKKKLLDDTFAEAEERLLQLKQAAEKTINTVKLEMPEGITQLEIGTQSSAEVRVNAPISGVQMATASNKAGVAAGGSGVSYSSVPAYSGPYDSYAKVYESQGNVTDDDTEIPGVNPLLDESIPFSERYETVKEKKSYMIAEGEHFHKMFDDVLTAVMENANPYLIGPSGCGKTYMVSQIAKILDMAFIDIGYINEEYDILGFQTANGGYSRPNFYRCYKYGKIAFCDELDNGNSRATVKLNSFLSNLKDASYSFPNGENVKRHPNFRIIGAGNTDGNGADSNYNSREKIEESVQQRFTPIYIGYDNEVEKQILADYPDWYDFVVLFRMATDEWGRKNYGDAPGIITTRDATRIKKYNDNQSFDMKQILEYEFIQTKDITYLAFIEDFIRQHVSEYGEADRIYRVFSDMISTRRS